MTRGAGEAEEDSSFCEVLGPQQRAWLDRVLSASTAPVKLIASGSVVFGSSGLGNNSQENSWQGYCSGGQRCTVLGCKRADAVTCDLFLCWAGLWSFLCAATALAC